MPTLNPFEALEWARFKQVVLQAQIRNARSKGREFVATIPDDQMEEIEKPRPKEKSFRMKKEAARHCRKLLADARNALDAVKQGHITIGLCSAYRTVEEEQRLWDSYFGNYYRQTTWARYSLGSHGDAAAAYLAAYIGKLKAAPGYGNHSRGLAVDFTTTEAGVRYGASKKQFDAWKKTQLWKWLHAHAKDYGFKMLETETWHWDYVGM